MTSPTRTALALSLLLAAAQPAIANAPAHPPHTIPGSQLRVLPPTADGRHYQLHVGLPASHGADPARRYPVVYVTDGYWDFVKINAIAGVLVYDKVVPEFITVGLGYAGEGLDHGAMRRWELSPVPFDGAAPGTTGQAAKFLATLETTIIPFIEREYQADPAHRVLCGASLGGLFTLYAMYSKPELFQACVAATPAVVVGGDWLLGYADAFAQTGRTLPVRLHVTGGGNETHEFLGGILRYHARVARHAYPGLAYEFRIIDGERHGGMQLEAYTRGLRFAFAPLAPESGPQIRR